MANLTPWLELPKIIALSRRDRKAMEAYQERQLLRLVKDLYSGNEFYRRLWDEADFDLSKFKGSGDLAMLPLVTKQKAREMIQPLLENPPRGTRLVQHRTSGSSGEPFEVVRSWNEERFLTVVSKRASRSLGFRARLRQARIRVPADYDWLSDRPLRMLNKLGLHRSRVFSCYDPPDIVWRQLSAYQPHLISGYSESIAGIARYGKECGLSDLRPKYVVMGGETCTPLMQRQVSEAFRAPVYQTYATTECNLIAWSCPKSNLLHICDPTVLLEILDKDGKPVAAGETGISVVTALHSRTMPFVRFVMGDRVVKGPTPCPCGAPYDTLKSVEGREMDRLRLISGESLHGYILLNKVVKGDISWIRQYQLVQDESGLIELRIAPLQRPDASVLAELTGRLEESTAGTPFRIKLVEEVEADENGKFRLCICNLLNP
jgi:phenylacetate-CoA ligase